MALFDTSHFRSVWWWRIWQTKLWSISVITAEITLFLAAIQDEIFDKAFPTRKVPLVPPPSIWAQRGIVVSLNWISKVKKMRPITENGTGKTPKKRQHTKRGQKAINGVKKTITKVSQICTIFIKIILNCFESPIHCFKRADLIPLPLFLKPLLHHQTKVWFSQQFPKCGLVFWIIVSGPYLFFEAAIQWISEYKQLE